MFNEGGIVDVRDPHGPGWIRATFVAVAEDQPRHIYNRGVNDGKSYYTVTATHAGVVTQA